MKIQYFADTDTLLITLNNREVTETRDIDEDTTLDFDEQGRIVAITMEHASERADIHNLSFQQMPVPAIGSAPNRKS
jgi:YD repeat-containing protein